MKFIDKACPTFVVGIVLAGLTVPGMVTRAAAETSTRVVGKPHSDDDKKDSTLPPYNGMTKAQATKVYGEPDSIGHRDGEELWTYVLNRGENVAKSFVPFNFNNKMRYRLLTFKGNKVVKFHWDAPEKE